MRKGDKEDFMKIVFPLVVILLFCGCAEKKNKKTSQGNHIEIKPDPNNKISINIVGELRFRRSYANSQFREISDKEIDSIGKSNPWIYAQPDTTLLKKLQEFGVVNNDCELLRFKFRSNQNKNFELNEKGKKPLSCSLIRLSNSDKYELIIQIDDQVAKLQIEGGYGLLNEDIKYLLFDVIPGGYKEIIVLHEYYIMNGDNSDIYIYEIQLNH